MHIVLEAPATKAGFDEQGYLLANPDVAAAVQRGTFKSGRQHFLSFGAKERRKMRRVGDIEPLRREKMKKIARSLRTDMPSTKKGHKFNFLTDELRQETGIVDTDAVSANGYDEHCMRLVNTFNDGLVLDCGAGRRDTYFDNVVNFEIVDYDTTDVLGVGEELPFKDDTFDAVISVAVLEHVKDPFRCANEIIRVLKPGGELYCVVPFLQPLHGYPHHYYNMSHQGLRSLFGHHLTVTDQDVLASTGPIWALTWIVQRWAAQLPPAQRDQFLSLCMSDLTENPIALLAQPWVAALPKEAQFELASATALFATKPKR